MDLAAVLDATYFLRQSYHALPASIKSRDGSPVNGVLGLVNLLDRLQSTFAPTYLALVFDYSLAENFRKELYPAYKANRKPHPPSLLQQSALAEDLFRTLGYGVLCPDRFEADDLIATLTTRFTLQGVDSLVVGADKDLFQLVNSSVTIWRGRGGVLSDRDVEAQMGIQPELIPDLLGLVGDSVDNIPGVRGIGPKTAIRLLRHFNSLTALYRNLDEIKQIPIRGAGRLIQQLDQEKASALLSRDLATLRRDAPVEVSLEAFTAPRWRSFRPTALEHLNLQSSEPRSDRQLPIPLE